MVSLLREFLIANQRQGSYTLLLRRTAPRIPRDHGPARSRKARWQRDLRRNADVRDAAHLVASTSFRPVWAERCAGFPATNRKRLMTTGSTKPDAMPLPACSFVIAAQPVPRLGFTLGASLDCASTLKPGAAHGATHGGPVRRTRSVGARRPGVNLYGYQKNAGGWHPPGRNTDCRHKR